VRNSHEENADKRQEKCKDKKCVNDKRGVFYWTKKPSNPTKMKKPVPADSIDSNKKREALANTIP